MPENRIEWGILALGLAVLAALGAIIVLNLGDDPVSGTHAAAATPVLPTTTTSRPAGASVERAVEQRGVRLRLSATRGDSWLEVRSGSQAGDVLFLGTLTKGTARTFEAGRLWIRFGGASNLDARLNGRPLTLRFGTYDGVVTAAGVTLAGA